MSAGLVYFIPILLLVISNTFMTFAWYGHLKFPHAALWVVILASWGIALIEYMFAVPANRMGAKVFNIAELKTLQEVITLVVFFLIAVFLFDMQPTWHFVVGFSLIAAGAAFIFYAPGMQSLHDMFNVASISQK